MPQIVINVDPETHRLYKNWCNNHQTDMNKDIRGFIEYRIKDDREKEGVKNETH